MTKSSYKRWQMLLFLLSLTVLGSSFYFQYIAGLAPCPLCLMQRLCVFLLVVVGFVGLLINYLKAGKLLAVLQIGVALGGLFFAGRQLWLQSLPGDQMPACLPELDILVRYFPWRDVFHALLWGAGDCAEISWKWLGLTMPGWAALYFLFMSLTGAWIFWQLNRIRRDVS
ncbi:disulfide bond formation protein B [Legionella clemsonensis]|uniref:Disulfide bond formation protein B n=1 Tax=Legionella clemsonensis TaxID=1867846 RepID=A0A222NZQ7_9GAMM|nr:disulfide bond formation protein B [Legionella clemsonensis]ASQ45056.1 Disulfide bond formation protein B [Legionella clemsonensis]